MVGKQNSWIETRWEKERKDQEAAARSRMEKERIDGWKKERRMMRDL